MATTTLQPQLTEQELAAVLWAATDKAASKEADRDVLPANDSRQVRLMITGEIDGLTVHRSLHGTLMVGADQERAVSATPNQATLVALILSKLNEATRDKILADLPRQFAEEGKWADVSPNLVESAEQMLRDIRSKKTIKVRGNVRFAYHIAATTPKPHDARRPSRNDHRKSARCHEPRSCAK
ncbi:MAG: hypothetical protein H8E66_33860 [Planctomycetes bacterium]|nr:hypothetical protein [Planctomycetota bacterium]